MIRPLTRILSHHCQHFSGSHCHRPLPHHRHQPLPGCRHRVNDRRFCHRVIPNVPASIVPASTVYFRVPASISVLAFTSESSKPDYLEPTRFWISCPSHFRISLRVPAILSSQYAIVCKKSEPQQQNDWNRHTRPLPATIQQCQLWPQHHYPHHPYLLVRQQHSKRSHQLDQRS